MGLLPQTPPKETFCKKSPLESRKTMFNFHCLGFTDCSQGIKRPAYTPPTRLRRRDVLDQRIARLTRKKGHRPFAKRCTALSEFNPQNRHRRFAKCCSALSEFNPQNMAFGRKRLSGHILLSRYQKTGVRAAYSPSASLSAVQHLASSTRKIAIGDSLSAVQHLASSTRKSRPSVASNYQAGFCSQGIKRPAYTPPAFDGLYSLRMYLSCLR